MPSPSVTKPNTPTSASILPIASPAANAISLITVSFSASAGKNFSSTLDLKAYGSIVFNLARGNLIEVNPLFSNALLSIVSKPPAAISTVARFVVFINASAPITLTLAGITTTEIDVLFLKAPALIAITGSPSISAGITTLNKLFPSSIAVASLNPVIVTPSVPFS